MEHEMAREPTGATNLERQILSQPEVLERLLGSGRFRQQVRLAAEGLHRARRIWLVGTGTSLHAAELGASMIQQAGRAAQAVGSMQFVGWAPVIGPQDAIIVISHTAETAYALAARAEAFAAGLGLVMITKQASGFPEAVETVPKESAETYTVSYTAALLALAAIAGQLGADGFDDDILARLPAAVGEAIERPGVDAIARPERLLVLAGAGPAAVTAREGALKVREGSRSLAEGYDAEYLLHGSAVPLTSADRVVALAPPDRDGFVARLADVAHAAGVPVERLDEPVDLPLLLAQIPLTARLQLLALRFALERREDPDTVIVGAWDDPALWSTGSPTA
jgi:glutamine---fructose-6-phosphate transaminase (isomerizing)